MTSKEDIMLHRRVWDVDGVIRNFTLAVGLPQQTKWTKIPNDIWRDIDRFPKKYMFDAEPYADVVNFIKCSSGDGPLIFLTNQCRISQREEWTVKFIEKHFGKGHLVLFVGNFQEKINLLKYNDSFMLFDDYPFFFEKKGFEQVKSQVVLVDRPWNEDYHDLYELILTHNSKNELDFKPTNITTGE
jgi:hypothetical protein